MSNIRVIKKYPNRRLYDTEESRYITLADVRDLVINRVAFKVIDKKSGNDITRTILLQVISEQESRGEPVMSTDFLSQIIRAYETVMPGFVARYLEQSLKMFMSKQQFLRGQVKRVVGVDPVTVVADMTQKNFARFRSLQDEVFQRFSLTATEADEAESESEEPATKPSKDPGKRRKTG